MRLFELDSLATTQKGATLRYLDTMMDAESLGYSGGIHELADAMQEAVERVQQAMLEIGQRLLPIFKSAADNAARFAVTNKAVIEEMQMRQRWGRLYPLAHWIKSKLNR